MSAITLGGAASNLGRRSLQERQDVRVGLHPADEVHHNQDEQNHGQQDPQRAQGVPVRGAVTCPDAALCLVPARPVPEELSWS